VTSTRGRSCDGKKAHPTREAALDHFYRLVRAGAAPAGLSVYRCRFCGSYHVGHAAKVPQRKRAS
jgi:hypothetical protein